MDFQTFKTNVTALKTEVETLSETAINPQHKTPIEKIVFMVTKLSDFMNDDQNIKTLIRYDKKPAASKDDCPLDILCKDLLAKLMAVEPLLVLSAFDFMRPENQPTTNTHGQRAILPARNETTAFNELTKSLNELLTSNLLNALETLKYLGDRNKTLIILGSNGSGKTSFANYLKSVETHVRVIPASKPIKAMGYMNNIWSATVEKYNTEIYQGGDLKEDLLQKLIIGLCTEIGRASCRERV